MTNQDVPQTADMLTTAQAKQFLNVNRHTFEKHVRPNVPRIVLGRKHFYTRVDLENWLGKIKQQTKGRDFPSVGGGVPKAKSKLGSWFTYKD